MDPGGISVARTLPIDGALLRDVLLRLRRDCAAPALRWSLGDRGAGEVDVCFTSAGSAWTTSARLWSNSGPAVTTAIVTCRAVSADAVSVTIEANGATAAPGATLAGLAELARAALDELAEELLWHATRAGLTQSS